MAVTDRNSLQGVPGEDPKQKKNDVFLGPLSGGVPRGTCEPKVTKSVEKGSPKRAQKSLKSQKNEFLIALFYLDGPLERPRGSRVPFLIDFGMILGGFRSRFSIFFL